MPDRIGARHVFGILVPDFNSVVEPEMASLRPHGVSNQTARFPLDATVLESIVGGAERLAAAGVGSWIVGLSPEPFPGGMDLLAEGVRSLEERTGLPVVTPPEAVRTALESFGTRRVGIVTPFDDAGNENVRAVVEEAGFEVARMFGLARPAVDQIANTTDAETEAAFAAVAREKVDALVQIGTGLPMLHLVERLEATYDCPVVAANPASYWLALRRAGIADTIAGAGSLFLRPGPTSD